MPGSYWTKNELRVLYDNYERQTTTDFIHKLPKRTRQAINAKAKRLGLKKTAFHFLRDERGRFIKGNTPWTTGRSHRKETKYQMSMTHRGFNHTKEAKLKMSRAHKGKRWSEETHKRSSESRKMIHWNPSPEWLAHQAKPGEIPWNKGLTKEDHSGIKRFAEKRLGWIIPVRDTTIEVAMQNELKRRKIQFQKHISVCGFSQPDIVFFEEKIAVFCDGDYWHNYPNGTERDKFQNKKLKANGWIVLRFWEHEIRENVSTCVDEIENILQTRRCF